MGGGLMQLVAYGAQDIYLTGNPQITFFKVVYRRHTNFAMESIEQTFNGAAKMGQKFSCTIARNGDLLSQVYLEMDVKLNFEHQLTSIEVYSAFNAPSSIVTVSNSVASTSTNLSLGDFTVDNNNNIIIGSNNGAAEDLILLIQKTEGAGAIARFDFSTITNFGNHGTAQGSKRIAQRMINSVEVEIGGQCIDKQYGDWMDIWAGLTYSNEQYTKWDN